MLNPQNGYLNFNANNAGCVTNVYISSIDINDNNITKFLQTIDNSTSEIKGIYPNINYIISL